MPIQGLINIRNRLSCHNQIKADLVGTDTSFDQCHWDLRQTNDLI